METVGAVERYAMDADLKAAMSRLEKGEIAVGIVANGVSALVRAPQGTKGLDVDYLHGKILRALGIQDDAVREEHFLQYVRGIDKAIGQVRSGGAQAAFLLQPAGIDQVMEISLGGGVMPQKSTD